MDTQETPDQSLWQERAQERDTQQGAEETPKPTASRLQRWDDMASTDKGRWLQRAALQGQERKLTDTGYDLRGRETMVQQHVPFKGGELS